MRNRQAVVSMLLFTVVLAGACVDGPPTSPAVDGDLDASQIFNFPTQSPQLSLDARFAQLARDIPGFGGLYYDEAGRMHVHMVRRDGRLPLSATQLASTISAQLRNHARIEISADDLVIHDAEYDFQQLHNWHRNMLPVLSVPGAVFTDADERTNRLQVGIEPGTSPDAILQMLDQLGIPRDAVRLVETDPIVPLQTASVGDLPTLQDRIRPVGGGVQINFTRGDPPAGFLCTLGFSARALQISQAHVFFTNSHCTDTRGVVLGTPYWQHSRFVENTFIGEEILDPAFFVGGICPAGRVCRFSDAAVAEYAIPRAEIAFGEIYRPVPGTRFLPATGPQLRIGGERPFPVLGQALLKVGRTTGWSGGAVIATCGNSNVAGTNITMICQDWVQITVAGGDSGSPVFEPWDGRNPAAITNSQRVRLAGLLWGSSALGGGSFVMSAMDNIRAEIPGPWVVH